MSNMGNWDDYWKKATEPKVAKQIVEQEQEGDTTYKLAASWLWDCQEVEDWGCGLGPFKSFCNPNTQYIGIDGSQTSIVNRIVDLETYTSSVEGLLIRHVLEHNYEWRKILENALRSFTKRFCLVLFTPFSSGGTQQLAFWEHVGRGVPDLSLSREEIVSLFSGMSWTSQEYIPTRTQYGIEHVFFVER